jgi:NADH dehydrogenase
MNIVVVGGGPTGVEISGALAEMKRFILPKDYPELDFNEMNIYLLEASGKLLNGMSDQASASALKFLGQLGVNVNLNTAVEDFDGETVSLNNQNNLITSTLIWAAGVAPKKIPGLPETVFTRNHRIKTDSFNRIEGFSNIFALGDLAYQTEDKFPNGHPQLAQVGLQQASNLAKNLQFILSDPENTMVMKPFHYRDLGSMATVGKNMAVADFSFIRFQGFFAWLIWLFVHLMAILGVKNRIFIFLNWCWSYLTYDQSLRIILRNKEK